MSTCLWTFGKYLERVLLVPTLAVPAVYMVSGIAGGLASANLAVDRVTVTCTAAICGLVGGASLHICNALPHCSHLLCCSSGSLCASVMHNLTAYPRVQTCLLVHASLDTRSNRVEKKRKDYAFRNEKPSIIPGRPVSPRVQVTLFSMWTFAC